MSKFDALRSTFARCSRRKFHKALSESGRLSREKILIEYRVIYAGEHGDMGLYSELALVSIRGSKVEL